MDDTQFIHQINGLLVGASPARMRFREVLTKMVANGYARGVTFALWHDANLAAIQSVGDAPDCSEIDAPQQLLESSAGNPIAVAGDADLMFLPMIVGGAAIGALVVKQPEEAPTDGARVWVLADVAAVAGALWHQAVLMEADDERSAQLRALFNIANLIASPADGDPLPEILEQFVEASKAYAANLFRVDEEGLTTGIVASAGVTATNDANAFAFQHRSFKGGGLVATAARKRAPVILNDYVGARGKDAYPDLVEAGVQSIAAFPALYDSDLMGVLVIHSKELAYFAPGRVRALEAMVDTVSALMHNVRLRERVAEEHAIQRRKDALIAVASHEFRTPLTSIVGYAELLLSRAVTEQQREHWLRQILDQGNRLTTIVETLLDVQRIREGNIALDIEPVPPSAAFHAILEEMAPLAVNHHFVVDCPPSMPPAKADRAKLDQVLRNLVDNAIKFSPDGGRITLSARRETNQGMIVFAITDQGMGISKDDAERLFMEFERVDRREMMGIGGVGMGLYIVGSLVNLMDGHVGVDSVPGKGATFIVSIPEYRADDARVSLESAS